MLQWKYALQSCNTGTYTTCILTAFIEIVIMQPPDVITSAISSCPMFIEPALLLILYHYLAVCIFELMFFPSKLN